MNKIKFLLMLLMLFVVALSGCGNIDPTGGDGLTLEKKFLDNVKGGSAKGVWDPYSLDFSWSADGRKLTITLELLPASQAEGAKTSRKIIEYTFVSAESATRAIYNGMVLSGDENPNKPEDFAIELVGKNWGLFSVIAEGAGEVDIEGLESIIKMLGPGVRFESTDGNNPKNPNFNEKNREGLTEVEKAFLKNLKNKKAQGRQTYAISPSLRYFWYPNGETIVVSILGLGIEYTFVGAESATKGVYSGINMQGTIDEHILTLDDNLSGGSYQINLFPELFVFDFY